MEGEREREKLDFSVALPSQDEERRTGTGGWREGGGRRRERGENRWLGGVGQRKKERRRIERGEREREGGGNE